MQTKGICSNKNLYKILFDAQKKKEMSLGFLPEYYHSTKNAALFYTRKVKEKKRKKKENVIPQIVCPLGRKQNLRMRYKGKGKFSAGKLAGCGGLG